MSDNKEINYQEYTFENNAKLEISGQTYGMARELLTVLLDDEFIEDTRVRFVYVNPETGEALKKGSKVKGKPVFDPERTMDAEMETRVTQKGQKIMKMIAHLNSVHMANVDKGRGTLLSDLAKKYEEHTQQPKLTKVED